MNNTKSSYTYKINADEWNVICTFLVPWLQHPETGESIEKYYELHRMYYDTLGLTMIITLEKIVGVMMFISLEQIVIYPQDEWQYIEIYYEDNEPVGYNIVPKIKLK